LLYLVATPIGNLEDITARALRVLREADVVAAEDTRVTKNLLRHFGIETPLIRCDAHVEHRGAEGVLERLRTGQNVALVSDAGTPLLSDPGQELVAAAIAEGIPIEPVPGASALLAALVGAGLPCGRFVFEGFLPRTNDRRERLAEIAAERRTVILYESPHRLIETLTDLIRVCGKGRGCSVGRELTKKFEEFVRGDMESALNHFQQYPPRGECVVVVGPGVGPVAPLEAMPVEDQLSVLLAEGVSAKDAARQVAAATGRSRRELYSLALQIPR
jgi:16S rRNA (cytidine1402-2'-O)-methyltransferase